MAIVIGVDIGQKHCPSALCVAETKDPDEGDLSVLHRLIRHLERLPKGASSPEIAKRVATVALSAGTEPEADP